jgi:hypothetical protein
MTYILAILFIAVLIFEYFQTKQFIGVIRHLTQVIADLKSFIVGRPNPEAPRFPHIEPPSHPDFGLGNVISELNKAENGEEI